MSIPTFPRGLCGIRNPALSLPSGLCLIVFCIDLIADHKDVTCLGRTLARCSADLHPHLHHHVCRKW